MRRAKAMPIIDDLKKKKYVMITKKGRRKIDK